jgi:hypothetical protein
MTEIFPGEGQPIHLLINQLTELGLVYDKDFHLHYTWDAKPYVQASDVAYEQWTAAVGGADADTPDPPEPDPEAKAPDSDPETPTPEPEQDSDTSGAADARRTTNTKRGK